MLVMTRTKLLFFLLSLGNCHSVNRSKKVIWGYQVRGRDTGYDAVQYFAAIGTLHGEKWYAAWDVSKKRFGIYGYISCGGAILTPGIIQTGCHCLASFDARISKLVERLPQIDHHWERIKVAYVGVNDQFGEKSMMTTNPLLSQKFFVHKSCKQLPKKAKLLITHDYGYITVDPSWIDGKAGIPIRFVKFAPTYTIPEMTRAYVSFLRSPPVCLNLGFGVFDLSNEHLSSDFLRAGWVQLINDAECRNYTAGNLSDYETFEYKNWVCSWDFIKFYQPIGQGDSGGPFTCNNIYFGVTSAYGHHYLELPGGRTEYHRIGIYGALVFAAYQNSIQYRGAFIKAVDVWYRIPYAENGCLSNPETTSTALFVYLQRSSSGSFSKTHSSVDLLVKLTTLIVVYTYLN